MIKGTITKEHYNRAIGAMEKCNSLVSRCCILYQLCLDLGLVDEHEGSVGYAGIGSFGNYAVRTRDGKLLLADYEGNRIADMFDSPFYRKNVPGILPIEVTFTEKKVR